MAVQYQHCEAHLPARDQSLLPGSKARKSTHASEEVAQHRLQVHCQPHGVVVERHGPLPRVQCEHEAELPRAVLLEGSPAQRCRLRGRDYG